MVTDHKMNVRRCSVCEELGLRVYTITTPKGREIDVARCNKCDAAKCAKCENYTFDPEAKMCRHCGCHFDLRSQR